MKLTTAMYLLVLVLAATGTLVLAGCSSNPEPETDPAAEVVTVQVFEVFGMDCPGCHGGLEKLVLGIPGVGTAKASWQDKNLTLGITDGAEVSDDDVREAVARANFTAGERLK